MSQTETNRRIVTNMYRAAQRGDLEAFMADIAEDVLLHEPPYLSYGGVYSGIGALREVVEEVAGYIDLGSVTIDRIVADEDHVFGILRAKLVETGEEVTLTELSILRDGKLVELRVYYHDAASLIRAEQVGAES